MVFFTPPLRRREPLTALAAASLVMGTVGYRLSLVIPPQIEPVLHKLASAYYHPRNTPEYFPTAMEWLASLGIVVGGCWLFWLGTMWLRPGRSRLM